VLEQYYPLQASKDVCFEIGRLLMGLKEYVLAVDFFKRSHEACGEHHVTWHNTGICFFYLDNFNAAATAFKRSLAMKPDYRESQSWLAKVCVVCVCGCAWACFCRCARHLPAGSCNLACAHTG
jgi:hypothetical protein